jgi:hypothetical protein
MPDGDLAFMIEIDRDYRERSGLAERRFYSIFYSRITPSPLMILGINPGGDPATWTMSDGADEFCSDWQHDYVDERYPIQAAMLPLLTSTLQIDPSIVRRIPKTNMVFRRSSQEKLFAEQQAGMSMAAALTESAPVLERIVRRVAPRVVLFEGMGALSRFIHVFGTGSPSPSLVPAVTTPNGRHRALIYAVHEIRTHVLPEPITGIALAHPSKYAARAEFEIARTDIRDRLLAVGEELRRLGSALAPPSAPTA